MTVTRRSAAKKVVKQKAAPKKEHPGKNVEVKVELTIMVAVGKGDPRTIEQVRDDIREDLMTGKTQAKLVTNLGGYYLVDGKVCLPDDYDPTTRGFKPGAHPPLWAMAPDEREILKRIEREKNTRPPMARNPENLRTASETDAKEKRVAKVGAALRDLHENTEWGKRKQEEAAARESASDDEEEPYFEEDEFEEGEFEEVDENEDDEEEPWEEDEDDEGEYEEAEWDEDDVMNEDVADEAIESQTSSALEKLKSGKRTIKTVAKPAPKKRVVRRR